MNAICLIIDRLSAGFLGAYGNTWIVTPALDRFASEGFVLDQVWSESPSLDGFYRSVWQGLHPLICTDQSGNGEPGRGEPLPHRLARAGIATTLMTDEWAVTENPLAGSFDDLIEIEPKPLDEGAASIEQTHAAECFARIIDWLETARGPFCLWCHLTGLAGAWDAPYEFRERYAEEDDPPPPATVRPPSLLLEEDYDPDTLLGISHSYAGQLTLFDTCIGALADFVTESHLVDDTLLAITSPRGYPLGEHRQVGSAPVEAGGESLHGELLHVPLMIRFPASAGKEALGTAQRSQALVVPADLGPTLLDWWGQYTDPGSSNRQFTTAHSLLPLVRGDSESLRDRICMAGEETARGIRVPAWYLRMQDGDSLYVKPDDRWEFNDVSDRCGEVVESLHIVADEFERHVLSEEPTELSPLDDNLIHGLE